MKTRIHNSVDLQAEILRLKGRQNELEMQFDTYVEKLKHKAAAPFRAFARFTEWMVALFGSEIKAASNKPGEHDWVTNLVRVSLPLMINRMFFPKSGIIMKSLIALLSQSAAKSVNKDTFVDLAERVNQWIRTIASNKKRGPVMHDYGIPPDSETF